MVLIHLQVILTVSDLLSVLDVILTSIRMHHISFSLTLPYDDTALVVTFLIRSKRVVVSRRFRKVH